ncbi:sensor histidine kinase [Nitratireductor mangrovi]|uniref:histidine kinase n=1 Tax=Nitratireductor mangrovi TaxID=2599600 RepID=A0A5B8L2D8_9HYPH|nr:sensor histidine kinase [Nitratireductor mangrovi]QDZ02126.2 sensor histidine kinase [Nitratireductor mangrovi]
MTQQQLEGRIDYYLDADWDRSVEGMLAADAGLFRPVTTKTPDFGYTKSRVWLRVAIRNELAEENRWRIYFAENFMQMIDVFVARDDGTIENVLSQDPTSGFATRPIPYPELVAPFEIGPDETATILVRYWSGGSSELSFSFETADSFAAISTNRTARNFVFYGMTMLLVIIALIAMLIFRHVVFLAYVAQAGCTLLFLMHADGVAFQYIWPGLPTFNAFASIATGSGFIIFGGIFARIFLQTRRYHPRVDKLLLAMILATVAMDLSAFFLDHQMIKKVLILMALAAIALNTAAGLVAARTRFKEVRFFVVAWTGAAISVVIMTLRHWLGIEIPQQFEYDSMRVVMVFDATMMGLAIADRYNQLRQSRQRALKASLVEAQRNLVLNERMRELEEQYALAESMAKSRDEQLYNTVHDLRQPLHALRLNVRKLIAGKGDASDSEETIKASFAYLEGLVAQQLERSQEAHAHDEIASHGRDGGEDAGLGLQAVLASIHEMFLPDAREKGLDFVFVPGSGEVEIEPLVLMRCVSNIVSNAIKYTTNGRILMGTRRAGDTVRIEVHDTGTGMSAAEFEQARKRHARLEHNRDTADGHGYGLAIASELAAKHGMRLKLARGRRHGSGVTIEIPLSRRASAAA